nr:hypothetical protein Itr_chr02CG00880 [Ipomoea trifida]
MGLSRFKIISAASLRSTCFSPGSHLSIHLLPELDSAEEEEFYLKRKRFPYQLNSRLSCSDKVQNHLFDTLSYTAHLKTGNLIKSRARTNRRSQCRLSSVPTTKQAISVFLTRKAEPRVSNKKLM